MGNLEKFRKNLEVVLSYRPRARQKKIPTGGILIAGRQRIAN